MKDLLEALTILAIYAPENNRSPTHCSHDQFAMDELGFFPGGDDYEPYFISFRFGSA